MLGNKILLISGNCVWVSNLTHFKRLKVDVLFPKNKAPKYTKLDIHTWTFRDIRSYLNTLISFSKWLEILKTAVC